MLKDAGIALKQAKQFSRGKASFFSDDLSMAARARMYLLTRLRADFFAERLLLVFQPQIELASGRVIGAEALLRSVAMDDFGTGYSSLGILKQLEIDRLKIDRAFAHQLGQPDNVDNIAKLIVALEYQCNLVTIAEGVENETQRIYL